MPKKNFGKNQQNPQERLFIKVILPNQGVERKVIGGGAEPKPFRHVDTSFRESLSTRIRSIEKVFQATAARTGTLPVRVKLISKAQAKSHRPETLFSDSTCPIIGAGKLGELFVKATSNGLKQLDKLVLDSKTEAMKKEISTIDTIEPVTPNDRRSGLTAEELLKMCPKVKGDYLIKIQLFDFPGNDQQKLIDDFFLSCKEAAIKISKKGYSDNSYYYEAFCKGVVEVEKISKIVGIRSVKKMPTIKAIHSKVTESQPLPKNLPKPEAGENSHPVVAVVDSGVTDELPELNQWIVGRESMVASPYRNTSHGTFVAGLVCWAKELNPDLGAIDGAPCSVFDLQVLPNWDPGKGAVDDLTETQLLEDLEKALKQHANEIKVWNLSLGFNEVCSLDEFSSLAVELDNLQEKYNVSFVISAGNYRKRPLLDYPRSESQLEEGRITTPADSVLGITVGSVAHKSPAKDWPKKGEPSAFSRHGAGPNHIIKPDLVHYGGTANKDLSEKLGICSIDGKKVGNSIGTSFSAPIISRLLGNIYHNIIPTPSPVLARAILTHHCRDPRTGGRVPDNEENFIGFGIPMKLSECLECNSWTSTLVFEDILRPGYFLEWNDFPYPNCLKKNGKYFGDIWMTVAFAPSRGERWGVEYCETHVEAHFGVHQRQTNRKTGKEIIKFRGLVPPEHKSPGLLYESYQIEKLRKWAPVRTYFGSLGKTGERGENWRLKVRLLTRHGIALSETMKPQRFALILTISDPHRKAPVYNDMAVNIRTKYKVDNLTLRAASRVQVRQ